MGENSLRYQDIYAEHGYSFYLNTAGEDLSNKFCSHSGIVTIKMGGATDKVKGKIYVSLYGTKGSTVLLEITDGKTTIKKNEVYESEIDFADQIGEIETVKLIWEKDEYEVTRPRLHVDVIEVYLGDQLMTY